MALYDGTYCDLRELHCAMCNVSGSGQPSGALLRCSRCGVLHYCSVECQRQDFARHKKDCRGVQRAREKVEREAGPLRRYSAWGEEPCNLFETDVGEFWVRAICDVLVSFDFVPRFSFACLRMNSTCWKLGRT
jgi:MYND finger